MSVAFDLPTQMGLDSDDPLARGEVGKVGVAIDSVDDLRVLFDGISLGDVSTSMTINSTAAVLLLMYQIVAEEGGVDPQAIRGTIQNDVLKEYTGVGSSFIFPPRAGFKLAEDVIEFCANEMPKFHLVTVNTHCTRENGTDAVQEAAIGLSSAFAYLEGAVERGVDVSTVARRVSFHISCDSDFFEDIAKIRAMRRIWADRQALLEGTRAGGIRDWLEAKMAE